VQLTSHLDLVPRIRMSGSIPLFPLCAFRNSFDPNKKLRFIKGRRPKKEAINIDWKQNAVWTVSCNYVRCTFDRSVCFEQEMGEPPGSTALFVLSEPLLRSLVAIVRCRRPAWPDNNGIRAR
jgi:hypothetical protein